MDQTKSDRRLIKTVNDLIRACRDRENGFAAAGEAKSDRQIKVFFAFYMGQSARLATELQIAALRRGGDPEREGSMAGAMKRGFMKVRAMAKAADDQPS